MDQTFERIHTVETALHFLKRFDRYDSLINQWYDLYRLQSLCLSFPSGHRLHLPCLDIAGRFETILGMFVRDLEFVQKLYNKQKESPPLPRAMPPISGRIAWVRQLYRRISSPIDVSVVPVCSCRPWQ